MRRTLFVLTLLLGLTAVGRADGLSLVIDLPPGAVAKSAVAAEATKGQTTGSVSEKRVTFTNLLPDVPYDVQVTLNDGSVLQGVDLTWYNLEPSNAEAGPLSADDHEQIRAIVQDIKDFYNRKDILILSGDHDRAVALTRLMRDTDFHSNKGGEVIWRIELWYFKFEYGGWEKIAQTNRVLRRERFKSQEEYQAATSKLVWTPQLGGIRLAKDHASTTITLSPPATQPAP